MKTGMISAVTSTLKVYGERLEDFQATAASMRKELSDQQSQIDKHQRELEAQQGKILEAHTELSKAQTNIEAQQIQLQDVSVLVDNLYSRMTFETFSGFETNRVFFQKLTGTTDLKWKVILKLKYAPIPQSLQGTIYERGNLFGPQALDAPIVSSNNLALAYLMGDWTLTNDVFTVQYVRDSRRTNLIHKIEFHGNEVFADGQQLSLKMISEER